MATLTITTTAAHAARALTAFGDKFNLKDGNGDPRDATAAEMKDYFVNHMKGVVHSYETRVANTAASAAINQIDPT